MEDLEAVAVLKGLELGLPEKGLGLPEKGLEPIETNPLWAAEAGVLVLLRWMIQTFWCRSWNRIGQWLVALDSSCGHSLSQETPRQGC